MLITILTFLLVLSILVIVHEWGHFYAARKFGCKVEEFGFGFPPRLYGFRRKKDGPDGTLYSINWIPLGGFVRIKGEGGQDSTESDSFANKKIWQRGIILAAGVFMNVVLTIVLITAGYVLGIPQALDGVPATANIADRKIQIIDVTQNSPAQRSGIEVGDALLGYYDATSFNPFVSIPSVQEFFGNHGEEIVSIAVKKVKDNQERQLQITPEQLPDRDKASIGVAIVETGIVSYPVFIAPFKGIETTALLTKQIFFAFGGLLRDLVVERKVSVDVTGPVGIAVLTGQVARQGGIYLLYFISILSLNLAIINFLPIPALDGGRFLFLVMEKIRRRPIDHQVENVVHTIGFALLLLLVLVVTVRDVRNFSGMFGDWWQRVIN